VSIDIINESGEVPAAVPEEELHALATYVLTELKVHPRAELAVSLVDEAAMEALHRQWMDLAGPTDVMSFPMDELRPGGGEQGIDGGVLGDVVLCPAVARRQAANSGHSTADELLLLLTHGVLHLLGFDHAEAKDEREMFDLQRTLLLTYLAGRGRSTSAAPAPRLGTSS